MQHLDCAVDILNKNLRLRTLCLWDQPDIPTSVDPEKDLFCYSRDIGGPRRYDYNGPKCNTLKRRFFKYLSLISSDGEYTNGLTVYTLSGRIVGLEAHFGRVSCFSGQLVGCPQYLPLQPNERIAYAWLRILDDDSRGVNQRSLDVSWSFNLTDDH